MLIIFIMNDDDDNNNTDKRCNLDCYYYYGTLFSRCSCDYFPVTVAADEQQQPPRQGRAEPQLAWDAREWKQVHDVGHHQRPTPFPP